MYLHFNNTDKESVVINLQGMVTIFFKENSYISIKYFNQTVIHIAVNPNVHHFKSDHVVTKESLQYLINEIRISNG